MTGLIPWKRKREPMLFKNGMFGETGMWRPMVDVREEKDEIIVKAEIPGMEKEDIDVSIKGRFLTIKGEKSKDYKKEKKGFFKRERSYGYFERTIELPYEVDAGLVTAVYKRGVLTMNMKKTGKHSSKAIPVSTGKGE